jgi:signal transduction histidine kinase
MASLGELTAGIAHEIQNPLNFVHNFSEINIELLEDLETSCAKVTSERDETTETELLINIKKNTVKINHHGKRVDAIVKGMLQHSRQNTGVKERINVNALCDECLKLAFHSFRAKESNLPNGPAGFYASFATEFDPKLPTIQGVPQDIGRVLLNIINNAFYAVNEKRKTPTTPSPDNQTNGDNYQPQIKVCTRKIDHDILIMISDNGSGIPDKIIGKIFQPFFTTKPTGEGTGLGLSLSYDIIKGHGGYLEVQTKLGEGSVFTVRLSAT